MKEYKILKKPFSWSKGHQKFEDELNKFAHQGWCVINISFNGTQEIALLERDKNR